MIKKENYGRYILKAPLAIEFYCDVNNIGADKKIDEMFDMLKKYRQLDNELKDIREQLVEKIDETIDYIGESNFKIYDNGDIEYIFNKEKEKLD